MALYNRADDGHNAQDLYYDQVNTELAAYALLALGCSAAVLLVWSASSRFSCYLRQIACLSNKRQQYFRPARRWLAAIRKHILYASLFHNRRHREFRLSAAANMGALPSRTHSMLLIGILAMNVTLCTVNVPYSSDRAAKVIRNRTGIMATMNLIPLVLFAGRNNPLIYILRVPYDTFNLFHRWLARIVVLQALAHVFAWCIPKAQEGKPFGWNGVRMSFEDNAFTRTGLVAACAFALLLVHSPFPIRHAFYETFLHLHIATAATAFIFLWIHLDGRRAQGFLLGAIILWAVERSARILNILYRNCGRSLTTAVVETLPDDILRIALYMSRPWPVKPGQHVYLYIPAVGIWTSHPFSVCWSDDEEAGGEDNDNHLHKTAIYLLVRRRSGFTHTLARRAARSINGVLSVHAVVEGPYGAMDSLDSFGTVLLLAGGVGITHHLLFLSHLVRGHAMGTVAARRIQLVWAIRSPSYLEWIEEWLGSITLPDKREVQGSTSSTVASVLQISVYVTGSCDMDVAQPRLSTMQVVTGRPDFDQLLAREVENQIGAMGVLCCGSGGFSDDVRRVCREAQGPTEIVLFEQSFT
ncbi:unnamed protein product [Penicillium egyptiacum]|uniref:ferric-chelate reductase (NADPH) n=1 Tax=Penicillium egyptiacum TaxID=1303716 RepID=A0A9W4K860_9EURO|nr:unnamed protein product [Penicillium egyptiacum]